MKQAIMSECKNPEHRSNKDCVCGGHNASNPKKNKKHHSTKIKLLRRKLRKWLK